MFPRSSTRTFENMVGITSIASGEGPLVGRPQAVEVQHKRSTNWNR
jgi:hypothetical protein